MRYIYFFRKNNFELKLYDNIHLNTKGLLTMAKYDVTDGVTKSDVTLNSNDSMYVYSGGTATGTTVNDAGRLYVSSGGSATDNTVYLNGCLDICNGGLASNTTIKYYGISYVSSGGTAADVNVFGGAVHVFSGGKVTGKITLKNDAGFYLTTGSILDFDISGVGPENDPFVNDFSLVQYATTMRMSVTPTYTLTVSGTQANGKYKLAGGAAGFDKTITLVNTLGESLGSLTLAGGTQTIGGVDYTLNLGGDNVLSVTVGAAVPDPGPDSKLFFTGDFDNGGRALLAVEKDGAVRIYANGAEWGGGLTLDPGWEVVGTGDFNADKKDDFLRVNTEGYVVGEMSNGDGTFAAQVLNLKNAGWSILGTGDFNGNGSDDVLIANPTAASDTVGLLGYWESGVTWTLINGYSAEWEMVSCGDFNGDGKCDMLWRNSFVGAGDLTYNAYCTWIVENPVDWRMVSVANPSEWNFLCAGDFNGDKMNDIAMINDVGVVGIWGVNDVYLSSWSILSAVTSEWTLAGVGDFNGDGTDDIAWSNTDTGLTGYWQINDKTLTTWANLAHIV